MILLSFNWPFLSRLIFALSSFTEQGSAWLVSTCLQTFNKIQRHAWEGFDLKSSLLHVPSHHLIQPLWIMYHCSTLSCPTRPSTICQLHLLFPMWPLAQLSSPETRISSSSLHWSWWYKVVPSLGKLTRTPTHTYNTFLRFMVGSASKESLKRPSGSVSSGSHWSTRLSPTHSTDGFWFPANKVLQWCLRQHGDQLISEVLIQWSTRPTSMSTCMELENNIRMQFLDALVMAATTSTFKKSTCSSRGYLTAQIHKCKICLMIHLFSFISPLLDLANFVVLYFWRKACFGVPLCCLALFPYVLCYLCLWIVVSRPCLIY